VSEVVITYAGPMPQHPGHGATVRDLHSFVPCLQAMRGGELLLKVWVELTGHATAHAITRLERDGTEDAGPKLDRALIQYGVRRLEAVVADLLAHAALPDAQGDKWQLSTDDLPSLLALVSEKSCEYQKRVRRDLFCTTPSPRDETAMYAVDGQRAGPTSRSICAACDLPSTDYLCSNFLHPEIHGTRPAGGIHSRQVSHAICDLGKAEIREPHLCRAGGHACWQRIAEADVPVLEPISPLGLAESFDMLDAVWRLAFGKNKRLVAPNTVFGPAGLSLGCANRAEFESRLSALADLIGRLKVDASLLAPNLAPDAIKGSLDGLEQCLKFKLPAAQHPAITDAIGTIRRVSQARNAIQHGITEGGGLTARLRTLGIHDAPPNWAGAWDSIRLQTANALTIIRNELRQWVDSMP
jgi:hypothetical protein